MTSTHSNNYDVPNQMHHDGIWSLGGQVDIDNLAGGYLSLEGVPMPSGVTMTPAKGLSSNICIVTFQFTYGNGTAIANTNGVYFKWWLSDSATGAGLTATSASGAVAAGVAGTDLVVNSAKKMTESLSNAAGVYNLSITDTAKTLFYPVVWIPGIAQPFVGAQLVTGNYD